jgi:hypothetical protein
MRRHRPIEVVFDGLRECSACGVEVVGFGVSLRHIGEAIPVLVPEPEDARSVERALEIARSVALRMPGASRDELAEAVIRECYGEGLLRRNRGQRRGNVVLVDEEPRDPDHAERAAGERIPA